MKQITPFALFSASLTLFAAVFVGIQLPALAGYPQAAAAEAAAGAAGQVFATPFGSATCSSDNTQATIAWNFADAPAGSRYFLRVYDNNAQKWQAIIGDSSPFTANTYTLGITPGAYYSWWVHVATTTAPYRGGYFICGDTSPIPSGLTSQDLTPRFVRGTVLMSGVRDMYNGDIHYDSSDPIYPYKMWFFGWPTTDCNSNIKNYPGITFGCDATLASDAIFYARSTDGTTWQVYKGDNVAKQPQFDTTNTPSTWWPIIADMASLDGDPSVVKVGATYYMAYSRGGQNVVWGATSADGVHWTKASAALVSKSGLDYERPSLMYENGKFKLWFDANSSTMPISVTYAELAMATPSATAFLASAGNWSVLNGPQNPQLRFASNPSVIHLSDGYYLYAETTQYIDTTKSPSWVGNRLVEASSTDGVNWKVGGKIDSDPACASSGVPQAYTDATGKLYVSYGCQPQGDFRYTSIRRMSKLPPLTASCSPSVATTTVGSSITWKATATGGTGSYTYVWADTDGHTGSTGATASWTPPAYTSAGAKGVSVIAVDSNNGQAVGSCQASVVTSILPPPTNLKYSCTAYGTKAALSWNAVTGATSYGIRVNPSGTSGFSTLVDWYTGGTSYLADVKPGTTYNWWIHSNNSTSTVGQYTIGPVISCTAQSPAAMSAAPLSGTAPVTVTATITGLDRWGCPSPYTLDWGDGTNSNYGGVVQGATCTNWPATLQKTHTYTTGGSFALTFSTDGNTQTQIVNIQSPALMAPSGLKTSCTNGTVTLSWSPVAGASNYGIRIIANGSPTFYQVIDWYTGGVSYSTAVQKGTNYNWWVHANNSTTALGPYTIGPAFTCN